MKVFGLRSSVCSLASVCLILATVTAAVAADPTTRPQTNFVIILADDLGYGDLGCYGNRDIPTPALDQLAAAGLRFRDFHSSGNVCSPTRAGLVTGRYQQRAGIPGVINADPELPAHQWGLSGDEITFAEILQQAGYATAVIGKWHLGYFPQFNPRHHGFDRFCGFVSGNIDYLSHYDRMETYDWWDGLNLVQEEGYSTHLITKHAIDFIEDNRQRPFCLYIAHEAVHSPWQGPNDPIVRGPHKQPGAKLDRQRGFREMLIELDRSVGQIVDTIDRLSLTDRTLVFFCSDNGPAAGSAGPLRGRKGSNWEGGHRVPAIARWPGTIDASTTCDELCITLDLMPTMLSIAGAALPPNHHCDGIDLVPVMTGGAQLGDRKLYWNGVAMREGPWKLITPKGANTPRLYNLAADLGESNNLAQRYPQRVKSMAQDLAAWTREVAPKR